MVTMKDIALEAGVSRPTVSLILSGRGTGLRISDATRDRVKEAAERLGYRPNELARAMITGKSNFIACVAGDLSWEYDSRVLAGVVDEAERHNFFVKVVTAPDGGDIAELTRRIVGQRPAGLVCRDMPEAAFPAVMAECRNQGIPLALAGNSFPHDCGIRVGTDDVRGAEEATGHLLGLGHRDIAFASGVLGSAYASLRHRGFMAAMLRQGLEAPEGRFVLRDKLSDAMIALAEHFTLPTPPTAIFCASDNYAMLAVRAARRVGMRVPEDLSVVGYADMRMAWFCDPPLTTVAEPFEELGRAATALLFEEIVSQEKLSFSRELHQELPVKLVIRESTAKPRSAA